MAAVERYLGEDIYLPFKRRNTDLTYDVLDDFADIFVYISKGANVIKYSKNPKAGYTTLTRVSSTQYSVDISSEQSIFLGIGPVFMSSNCVSVSATTDLRDNKEGYGHVLTLIDNPTKTER